RLEGIGAGINVAFPDKKAAKWVARMTKLTGPLAKLSIPEEGWEKSPLRTRFMNAGFRENSVPIFFFGGKTLLALLMPIVAYSFVTLSGRQLQITGMLFLLLLAAAIGYYLPNMVLNKLVAKRKLESFENFPDALDLMTVCVEAGLAMDAALARVAVEIGLKSPALAEELHLVTLELRAGNTKEKALRNLALRTGVEDVDSLVAMLVQADKFGTSVASSLRVYSDTLRTKRRQRAEETAAKISTNLLFPLIFFIFPALLLVLLGPAFIQITRTLLPAMAGH
ncbi:MAG: type II secretion system F family protein, partial [Burkholderiales bacterium]